MRLRNYVYISKNKLDNYYPQIVGSKTIERTAKVSLNIGVFKSEIGATEAASGSDHERLESILSYLRAHDLVGTIDKPKDFFAGEADARSLIYGRMMLFGARRELVGNPLSWLALTCSMENMLGHGYRDLPDYGQNEIGPTRSTHFAERSDTIAFALQLRTIWRKEQSFVDAEFDAHAELKKRREKHELSAEQCRLIRLTSILNRPILFVHPSSRHSIRTLLLRPVFDPMMRLFFGKDTYRKKIEALKFQLEAVEVDITKLLSQEDLQLLSFIRAGVRHIDAPAQRYEFVALRLLEGEIDSEQILLGSPLYLAAIY